VEWIVVWDLFVFPFESTRSPKSIERSSKMVI
jgi:hypothetical protein